jgi:winged helix domain-containing protein
MYSDTKEKTPKAAATAKGEIIASLEANATRETYDKPCYRRKCKRLTAIGLDGRLTVTGQTAKALMALIQAGKRGVTASECDSWAYRLGAYVHTLRRVYRLSIETVREPHDGGWYGRYVLHTPVSIAEAIR